MPTTLILEDALKERTHVGELYETMPNNWVHCYACGHRCKIPQGRDGICRVRFNDGGVLRVPYGYMGAIQCDPIEKKPFFHALPGSLAMSFGMLGCDFHCGYCQNWVTSQALRNPVAGSPPMDITPFEFIALAKRYRARVLASTYNEPLITSEWSVEIFKEARKEGLHTAYISNGNGTAEVLDYLKPWVDYYKVDLKTFNDKNYRKLGGRLQSVLDTIPMLLERRYWVEIVTLIVPGFNDSDEELREIAEYLVTLSPDIPWHVTAFHKDYRMTNPDNTSVHHLLRAATIGKEAGLHYVYAGNLPGEVGEFENTYCPNCQCLLVERIGFRILKNTLKAGHCTECHSIIPGVWS